LTVEKSVVSVYLYPPWPFVSVLFCCFWDLYEFGRQRSIGFKNSFF